MEATIQIAGNLGKIKRQLLLFSFITGASITATAQTQSITYGGVQRTYIVHLPTGFALTDTLPVLFSLHGLVMNAQSQSDLSEFNPIADRERFIAVYPNGLNNSWNTFSAPYNSGVDDVGFISALIDTLYQDYHIDLNRVYSCGMSNGGFMSYRLACELSERIAAIASVTGSMTDSMQYYCSPTRPFPVLHFHGTSDPIVNYNGIAGSIKSVSDDLNYWVQYNGCPSNPIETPQPDINTSDQTTATKLYWGLCSGDVEVIHYRINGGGHTWPGNPEDFFGVGGNINLDVMASELIWDFFSQYTLDEAFTTGSPNVEPAEVIKVYPNPAGRFLSLASDSDESVKVSVKNLFGQEFTTRELTIAGNHTLDLSELPSGFYLVACESSRGRQTFKILHDSCKR